MARRHTALENEQYAEQLQRRRLALGLTLREVQEATGIQLKTLWVYEHGLCRPSAAKEEALETYYSGLELRDRAKQILLLDPRAREVVRDVVGRTMAFLAEINKLCSEPASDGAGAVRK